MKVVIKNRNYNKADIIKIIRDSTDLTQEEFAKEIGKTKSTIQKYELNLVNYPIETLLEIIDKFDIKITLEKQ
ncbi:MAG: helix-turn-helix transcriptional regulator [Bacilli bacterium]|nr:helix-turn-helix transcriptional regulator [Bacilli bacterium]